MTDLEEKKKACESEIDTLAGKQTEETEEKSALEEGVKAVKEEEWAGEENEV